MHLRTSLLLSRAGAESVTAVPDVTRAKAVPAGPNPCSRKTPPPPPPRTQSRGMSHTRSIKTRGIRRISCPLVGQQHTPNGRGPEDNKKRGGNQQCPFGRDLSRWYVGHATDGNPPEAQSRGPSSTYSWPHICQREIVTTRRAPTTPNSSYTPDASYDTSRHGVRCRTAPITFTRV